MTDRDIHWDFAKKIACDPEVDDALRNFSEDATEDNAVMLILTALEATQRERDAHLEERVERATMQLLGKPFDPAPGVNWECNRYWKVRRARNLMRKILQGDAIGTEELELARLGSSACSDSEVQGEPTDNAEGGSGAVYAPHGEGSSAAGEPTQTA